MNTDHPPRKKIAVDATPFLFQGAGVGRVTAELIRSIQELSPPFDFIFYSRRYSGAPASPELTGCEVKHFKLPKFCEPLMKMTSLIERVVKADLYHATDHYLPLGHPEKAVLTIHDMMFMAGVENAWRIHGYLARNVPVFAKKCKHIITCSEFTKKDIVRFVGIHPDKITVIPWGIDHNTFSPPDGTDSGMASLRERYKITSPYILTVSCSTGRKNTLALIRAWAAIARLYPEYQLVVVWAPPAEVHKLCSELNITDRIIFTGKVNDTTLRDLYRHGDFLVYPSLYEGFGLPVLEAMSCGMPVISSDVTSLPEVGGDLAVYIEDLSADGIAGTIRNFIDSRMNTPDLRRRCVEHASQFTWQNCAKRTIDIYLSNL